MIIPCHVQTSMNMSVNGDLSYHVMKQEYLKHKDLRIGQYDIDQV